MEVVIETYIKEIPNTFPDILNYTTNKLVYFGSQKKLNAVHNGQRKLFYSLLKFISIINRKDPYSIVYIGAAPGRNIIQAAKIFPNITFHLFDIFKDEELKYIIDSKLSNVIIYNKYFEETDKFGEVYLFSDIRNLSFSGNEDYILKDLTIQKQFVYQLNPIMYCLKFRIPFNNHKINYLDGLCYLQPFTKNLSNEVRLIGNSKNEIIYYLKEHEMKMFYINIILREWFFNKYSFDEFLEYNLAKKLNMTFEVYLSHVNSFTHNKTQKPHNSIKEYITDLNYVYQGINIFKCENISVKSEFFKKINTSEFNESLFLKSVTHSSVNNYINYEIYEYIGDRVLNVFISDYIINNFEYDIMLYSGILSYFASGEIATLVFAFYLELDKLLITHNNKYDKQLEDILESLLGFIKKEYGLKAAKTIVFDLLDKINFEEYTDSIYPPKSELKEFYDKKTKDGSESHKFKDNYKISLTKVDDEWTEANFTISLTVPDLNKTLKYEGFGTEKKIEMKAVAYFLDILESENIYTRRKINKIKKSIVTDSQPIEKELFDKFIKLMIEYGNLNLDTLDTLKNSISNTLINHDALVFHGDRILKLTISDYIESSYKGDVKLFNGIIATILTEDIFDVDIKILLSLVDKIYDKQYSLLGLEQCYIIILNILDSINLNDDNYKDKIFPPKTILFEIIKFYKRNINLYIKEYNEENGDFKITLDLSSFNMISPTYKNNIYDIKLKSDLQKKYEFEASKQFLKYLKNRGYVGNVFSTNFTIIRKV